MTKQAIRKITPFLVISVAVMILIQFSVPTAIVNAIAIAMVLLIGIPHGAIDHILYENTTGRSRASFYTFYLGSMALYAIIWLLSPKIGLWSFILLSAYHFGQSQFSDLTVSPNKLRALYLFWGLSILGALLYHNPTEIRRYFDWIPSLEGSAELLTNQFFGYCTLFFTIMTLILMIVLLRREGTKERLVMELLQFAAIHIVFFIFPLLPAFALYFALLHSLPVMIEEFQFIKKKKGIDGRSFILLMLPFTIFSLLGMAVLFAVFYFRLTEQPQVLLLFILIAVLTLPHSIVMERFYAVFYGNSD